MSVDEVSILFKETISTVFTGGDIRVKTPIWIIYAGVLEIVPELKTGKTYSSHLLIAIIAIVTDPGRSLTRSYVGPDLRFYLRFLVSDTRRVLMGWDLINTILLGNNLRSTNRPFGLVLLTRTSSGGSTPYFKESKGVS